MGTPHTAKPRRKAPIAPRPKWTQAELDAVLNGYFCVDDPAVIRRYNLSMSQALARGTITDHTMHSGELPIEMIAWKLATRYNPHDYLPGPLRQSRVGLPFTAAEQLFLKYAFDPALDGQARQRKPNISYVAACLCRQHDEVLAYWVRVYGGLGLRLPPE